MTDHPGLFDKYIRHGKNWLKNIPPEDRIVFSRLGHMALRARDIPLQHLGGKARVSARCQVCGRFQPKEKPHEHHQ